MKTISTVRRERRKVVLIRFIVLPPTIRVFAGAIKKTFTPGVIAWIKVLSTEFCPGPGPFDRPDGNRVGLFAGR